jgi:hypothetical protein
MSPLVGTKADAVHRVVELDIDAEIVRIEL